MLDKTKQEKEMEEKLSLIEAKLNLIGHLQKWAISVCALLGIAILFNGVVTTLYILKGDSPPKTDKIENTNIQLQDSTITDSGRDYYNTREVSELENVNTDSIRRWLNEGRFKSQGEVVKKSGALWKIPKDYTID